MGWIVAERTAIEWCDATFNPWIGCTRVSPACDDCYAARSTPARTLGVEWGPGQPRRRTGDDNWAQPKRWAKTMPARLGRRPRVFCASLADWLDNEVPIEWLVELLDLIRLTPELDWLLLSKRIGNWRKRLEAAAGFGRPGLAPLFHWAVRSWLDGEPPANVWLGATVVTQAEADRDIPKLLAVPARVRFLSVEPMLGPITLPLTRCDNGSVPGPGGAGGVMCPDCSGALGGCQRLHWVICGGESGPKARPMHPDWARSLRDQCAAAGVPFLFKQWGEWAPGSGFNLALRGYVDRAGRSVNVDAGEDFPKGAESADGWAAVHRIGKKAAGRLLDGREHNGFPEVRHA